MNCEILKSSNSNREFVVCQQSSDIVAVTGIMISIIALIHLIVSQFLEKIAARRKATLDMVLQLETSQNYAESNQCFSSYRRSGRLSALSDPHGEAQKRDRQKLLWYLNHYEMISLGMRRKRYDEDFYRGWMGGPFVRDWNAAGDWIQRERWKRNVAGDWEYDDNIFEHFEFIATRWSREARRLKVEPRIPPKDGGAGPGDEALPVLGDQPADVAVAAASPHPPLYGVRRHPPFVSFFTPKG